MRRVEAERNRNVRCWTLEPRCLLLDCTVEVTFQRTRQLLAGEVRGAASHGALPIAADSRPGATTDLLLPLADREAVWIGLTSRHPQRPAAIRISAPVPERQDLMTGQPWTEALVPNPPNFLVVPGALSPGALRDTAGQLRYLAREAHGSGALACSTIVMHMWRSLARSGRWSTEACTVSIAFVPPGLFTTVSGTDVPPLDDADTYRGWRLP